MCARPSRSIERVVHQVQNDLPEHDRVAAHDDRGVIAGYGELHASLAGGGLDDGDRVRHDVPDIDGVETRAALAHVVEKAIDDVRRAGRLGVGPPQIFV
jgi:hypothetical protein